VPRARRELREAVVLADEDHGQPPQRGEVDRLVEMTRLNRSVTEEDDRDLLATAQPRRERAAERQRDVAADDARGAHQAVRDVDEVHRPTEAAAETVAPSHQLGHHPPKRRPLGDRMPVRTMAAVDRVIGAQLGADGGGDALLADAQMDQAVDLVRALEHPHALLEHADAPHRAQQRQRRGGVERAAGRGERRLLAPHASAATGADPSTWWTAATILSSSGRTKRSIGSP